MPKFIIISILFHLTILTIFKLDFIEIKNENQQSITIALLEDKKNKEFINIISNKRDIYNF